MTQTSKRLTFTCHKCSKTYSLYKNIEEQPKLIVACPFCNAEAEVDLALYRSRIEIVYQDENQKSVGVEQYTFPDLIETRPREDTQSDNVPDSR